MTVPVSNRISQLYVGNGVITRFGFTFTVFEQANVTGIAVRVKVGSEFELLSDSLYDVTLNQDGLGGYITFVSPPSVSTFFYISGHTPVDQLLDITNYDNFYPDAIERALDKITAILQEWGSLIDFEEQSRILADIKYDLLAQARETDLKNYIDTIVASVTGAPLAESQFIKYVDSLLELPTLLKWDGRVSYVKETDSHYVFDELNSSPVSLDGWVLQHGNVIKTRSLGLGNSSDITDLIRYVFDLGIFVDLEANYEFSTTIFDLDIQEILVGDGSVKFTYNYQANDNTENVAPKIAKPYKKNSKYGWYDSVQARGNFEHGAGYGLIVNDDTRPQVCGFRTKQQQKDYPSVDMVGLYTHVASPRSVFLSNCTFTSNSVSSADLTSDMDIRVGDFIRTARDPAISMPWRSEITSIDFETKTLGVTWWLHESGSGEGTPPNGLTCEAPYTNGLWGHNTNVFLYNGRPAHTIIGYELGVYSEKTRDKFTSIDGYYVVNLTSQVARAQHAFKTGGTWDKGLGAYNCIDAVYTDGTTKNGLNFAPTADADSSAVRYDLNTRKTGKIIKSVAGTDEFFSISALGVVSHERQEYRVSSASDTQTALSPTLVLGANASSAHTTTINTTDMSSKTILTFRQLDAVNWTIVAGSSSFVLNTSGAMDYLQLFYDGSGFLKLFAGKSL